MPSILLVHSPHVSKIMGRNQAATRKSMSLSLFARASYASIAAVNVVCKLFSVLSFAQRSRASRIKCMGNQHAACAVRSTAERLDHALSSLSESCAASSTRLNAKYVRKSAAGLAARRAIPAPLVRDAGLINLCVSHDGRATRASTLKIARAAASASAKLRSGVSKRSINERSSLQYVSTVVDDDCTPIKPAVALTLMPWLSQRLNAEASAAMRASPIWRMLARAAKVAAIIVSADVSLSPSNHAVHNVVAAAKHPNSIKDSLKAEIMAGSSSARSKPRDAASPPACKSSRRAADNAYSRSTVANGFFVVSTPLDTTFAVPKSSFPSMSSSTSTPPSSKDTESASATTASALADASNADACFDNASTMSSYSALGLCATS
mmetsp:Transcript_4324/g.9341  ORF Transcript_4324/g.9341 Transcript_4324/m.9341 type:complete len:380 (+) Transcript_4324:98-1237(+)